MASIRWSREAKERLDQVPFLVRVVLKRRAEKLAKERGLSEVTTEILAQLRQADRKD